MSKEIITKISPDKNDDMKTNEIVEALDRIGHDRETLEAKGVSPQEIDGVLSTLGTQLTVKVSGAVGIMQKYNDLATAASARATALMEIARSYQSKVDGLREYLKYAMGASGTKKIEAEHYSITYSRIEQGSIEVYDEAQIPETYIKTKTVTSLDKVEINKAMKRGEAVAGARWAASERLTIKGV